jgi:hypothetical protein
MASSSKIEKSDFLLEDEIKHCLEGHTANLNSDTTIKFSHDDCLPEIVNGDLRTFNLVMDTLIEFAMKWSVLGCIEIQTKHDGYDPLDRNITKVGFNLTLHLNS